MNIKLYLIIYLFWFFLASIFIILDSDVWITNIKFIGFAFIGGTIINILVWIINRGDKSSVILKDNIIKFKGKKTPNDTFKLSDFDRLTYKEGLMSSYLKLERDEGEPPNWYKAFGQPKEEDKEKLKKLIEIANKKMKN